MYESRDPKQFCNHDDAKEKRERRKLHDPRKLHATLSFEKKELRHKFSLLSTSSSTKCVPLNIIIIMATKTTTTTTLLIIDGQNDFHPGGSLAIPTATEDANRIAQLIRTHGSKIDRIVATLDSHHKLDIAHPKFWISGSDNNKHPDPFTIISSNDIQTGVWKPMPNLRVKKDLIDESYFPLNDVLDDDDDKTTINLTKYAIEYTKRLEAKGRFQLCIWPEHCLIGSPGHCVVDVIRDALNEWGETTGGSVEWILKGQNVLTEAYSALEAEVPLDKQSTFNTSLQEYLLESDRLLVCGQAMSHCVNFTLRDILDHWPTDKVSNITLITDCASAVPGFETAAETFQKDMTEKGVILQTAGNVFLK